MFNGRRHRGLHYAYRTQCILPLQWMFILEKASWYELCIPYAVHSAITMNVYMGEVLMYTVQNVRSALCHYNEYLMGEGIMVCTMHPARSAFCCFLSHFYSKDHDSVYYFFMTKVSSSSQRLPRISCGIGTFVIKSSKWNYAPYCKCGIAYFVRKWQIALSPFLGCHLWGKYKMRNI